MDVVPWGRKRARREREEQARQAAVEAVRRARAAGRTQKEIAKKLKVSARTLRLWMLRSGTIIPLGRPVLRSPVDVRQRVIEQLAEWGPRVGVPTLRAVFPEVARAELEDLLLRFRAVHRAKNGKWVASLEWPRVGAVWAADFGQPPATMSGGYERLLCVRDLGSGMTLAWRPTKDETAETAVAALVGLFEIHGAPLVLKLDNGPAYRAEKMREMLAAYGVLLLYSPAYTPGYNSSAEAGVGSMKTRTQEHAERAGHPGVWTVEDAVAAQLEANAFGISAADPKRSPEQAEKGGRSRFD